MRTLVRIGLAALFAGGLVVLAPAQDKKPEDKKPDAGTAKTKIKVTVPQEDTELLIEDKPTKATGKLREFESPPLKAGDEYIYKFTAKWRPNNYTTMTRNKTVTFKGGDELAVDMTRDDPGDKAVIRYVPTPDDIVAEMMKLAKITKDDVVYEPGCGDARIVIAAVKAGAKKGVGIDLDPERIAESTANVKKAGLSDKIEIRKGDALEVDYSEATVIMSYMANEFNDIFRPVLWKQLKPGTRVVSHRFVYGDWKPETTIKVMGQDGDEYELHLWVVTKDLKDKVEKSDKKTDKEKDKK